MHAHVIKSKFPGGFAQQLAIIRVLFDHDRKSSPSVRLLIRQHAVTVLASKQAMVIGPTPPGTGVMAPATAAQLSVDLSYLLAFDMLWRNQACDAGNGFDTLCGGAQEELSNGAIRRFER